jgi:hypothetical protein
MSPAKVPYGGTRIAPEDTQAEIKKLLKKRGILDVQLTSFQGDDVVRFVVQRGSRSLLFEVRPPHMKAPKRTWNRELGRYEKVEVELSAQAWRLTRDYIEAKLKAIEWGLVTVETEFLPQMVTGDGRRLGDIVQENVDHDREVLKLEAPVPEDERRYVDADYKEDDPK